jgi:hypothetical protein
LLALIVPLRALIMLGFLAYSLLALGIAVVLIALFATSSPLAVRTPTAEMAALLRSDEERRAPHEGTHARTPPCEYAR